MPLSAQLISPSYTAQDSLPTNMMDLGASVNVIKIILHYHAQRAISLVTLDSVKLTINLTISPGIQNLALEQKKINLILKQLCFQLIKHFQLREKDKNSIGKNGSHIETAFKWAGPRKVDTGTQLGPQEVIYDLGRMELPEWSLSCTLIISSR